MALAIFDLDNTLLADDSDHLWGEFLVQRGIADREVYAEHNDLFYHQYQQGNLDIDAYLRFTLATLTQHPTEQLHAWREEYVNDWIAPAIASGTKKLLEKHRQQGDLLMIISATNYFITQPIAELLDVDEVLSTRPEIIDGVYTGNYLGTPTFQEGKVTVLNQWLAENNQTLEGSFFYSDSHNDLPLLEKVDHPVAVNPDESLAERARSEGWPILDLRQ